MKNNKLIDVLGTILLLIGFFFAFLPHALHTKIGLEESTSHAKHVIAGIIIVIVALLILIFNNRAFHFMK